MSNGTRTKFIETREYRQFAEFCDACQRHKYIGLCYGPPGVGKTLSAKRYARWDDLTESSFFRNRYAIRLEWSVNSTVLLYTPQVVNSPAQIRETIERTRFELRQIHVEKLRAKHQPAIYRIESRLGEMRLLAYHNGQSQPPIEETSDYQRLQDKAGELRRRLEIRCHEVRDPTSLIIVDEADRLKDIGLEQVRDIYDRGGIGVVLIGMPGLEKRLARYPQLYSRVGLVHQFRPISEEEVRQILAESWQPEGVSLPSMGLADTEVLAAILRITGGNFRLLHRLLTEMGRLVELNQLRQVTPELVDTAREGLVIGVD